MLIIGDKELRSNLKLKEVLKESDLKKIDHGCVVLFDTISKRLEWTKFCVKNELEFAVIAKSLADVLYANIEGANYIVVSKQIAKDAQDLADNYMFDAKILQLIDTQDEIEEAAKNHIDGVMYRSCIDGNC